MTDDSLAGSQKGSLESELTWVPLSEASDAAGVSRSTLRSWFRAGRLPSRMVPGPHGPQRVVPQELAIEYALQGRGQLQATVSDRPDKLSEMLANLLSSTITEREHRLEEMLAATESALRDALVRAARAEALLEALGEGRETRRTAK
jgi:hypothetical protein